MKTAVRGKTSPQTNFEDEYRSSLREYAAGGGELALGRAYELGRRALNEQKSLIEMASLHHHAVLALIRDAESDKQRGESIRAGSEFLAECLSPYEMAHRGFQDAVKALRQLNETLEEEIKRIAYAVHDEAGQLLVAVHLALAEMALELPEAQQGQGTRIRELLNEVEKHLRRYSHELRPTILDDLGWVPAIQYLVDVVSKRANIPIRFVIGDDHVLVRQGLRSLLEREKFQVVAEASDGQDAVRLSETHHPDIAVLDISMPTLNGIVAARELSRCCAKTKAILLTQHEEDQYIYEALEAGVKGYVLKNQVASDLIHAIQQVSRGEFYLSPGISRAVVEAYRSKSDRPVDPLTVRERQVLQLIAEGKSTKDTASLLGISVKTAESHRMRLMQKLDIHETASLVRYAVRRGLVEP